MSDANGDFPSNESTVDPKDPLFDPMRSSTEGSFLQFGRAVLGPTALSHKATILTNNYPPILNHKTQKFGFYFSSPECILKMRQMNGTPLQ